jgi:hypothetical protein
VTVETPTDLRGDMKNVSLWKFSVSVD